MGIFRRRGDQHPNGDGDASGEPRRWSGRPLRLQHPPDVEHAPVHAAEIVAATREIHGIELDYTPDSLDVVDQVMERFREHGVGSHDVAETLWGFGCYVGEVFVRHAGAAWIATPAEYRDVLGFPIALRRGENVTNPIGKVFKRLDNGNVDNLRYFYRAFTAD